MQNITAYCLLYPSKARLLRRGKRNFIYSHWCTKASSSSYVCTQSYMLIIDTVSFSEKVISCLVLPGWITPSSRKLIYKLKSILCSSEPSQQASAWPYYKQIISETESAWKGVSGVFLLQEQAGRHRNCEVQVKSLRKVSPADLRCPWGPWSPTCSEEIHPPIQSCNRDGAGEISYLDHRNCLV